MRFILACYWSLLSGPANQTGSGVSAGEARSVADRAIKSLRQAVAAGFRDYAQLSEDTDLDAIRSRPEFSPRLLDVRFPSDPFASSKPVSSHE